MPANQQDGATPFSPRCVKDVLEEELFAHRRDLLTTLDVVFMDTTSPRIQSGGAGGETLGQRGFSKDHRPDLNQMILAALLDGDGRPVCTEMWPGNTADVTSLIPAVDRLQRRFRINRVCVVADRGMICAETIAELEARGLLYVLGVRERSDKLVRDLVLDDPAPSVPFVLMKPRGDVDYEAKAVTLAGRRYIPGSKSPGTCRNLDEMKKDAVNRAKIVAALKQQLKKGDKSLVGNKGYRRFLANPKGEGFSIDRVKVEEDAKFDGVFVLQTNTHLSPLEAMLVYKNLWTVERTFRTAKSLFETRPTPGLDPGRSAAMSPAAFSRWRQRRSWRTAWPPLASAPAPRGPPLSPIWTRSPRPKSSRMASASCCAPLRVPPPAWRFPLSASPCRQRCARSSVKPQSTIVL